MLILFGGIVHGYLPSLGHSTSSFSYTLALILTWFVAIPALATFLIGYSLTAVLTERKENQARMRAYDEKRSASL
ncbi:hypothetical protein [Conexibacter sp. DBS9H8]|uniref:hypothetical protein n=1 Tax=Conexibacter sp. DBS9H8 TaxID=2937801 RepID=UPI00200C8B9B|nr:hypothetical protein [Conexibacter sp. DBS9H8]